MKSDIKLIVTDLDGTLLSGPFSVSERNIHAMQSASEQGIRIAIASGRTRSELTPILQQLPFLDYLIQANGATVTDLKTDKILLSRDIPYKQWVRLRGLLRSYGAVYMTYCQGASYIESDILLHFNRIDPSGEIVALWRKNKRVIEDATKELVGKGAEKLFIQCCIPEENLLPLRKDLQTVDGIEITSSSPKNLEINAAQVNKGSALAVLCKELRMTPDRIMAFGDADNDLEMLRFVGHSYAMANAEPKVKAAAKFRTARYNEDGVALAIERFLTQI